MSTSTSLALRSSAALLARHESMLRAWPTKDDPLIPRADLAVIIQALEASLSPARKEEVAGAMGLIATAWPLALHRMDESAAAGFAAQLREELERFPAEILQETVHRLRRSSKFLPSIAEVYEVANDLLAVRKIDLQGARRHLAEHGRREKEAMEEAERRVDEQRRRQERFDRWAATYGAAWPICSVDDIESACLAMGFTGVEWKEGLDKGELWAVQVVPLAIVAGRINALVSRKSLTACAASRLLKITSADLERVCGLVAAIEAGGRADDLVDRHASGALPERRELLDKLIRDIRWPDRLKERSPEEHLAWVRGQLTQLGNSESEIDALLRAADERRRSLSFPAAPWAEAAPR
jgi:hypothetical protein